MSSTGPGAGDSFTLTAVSTDRDSGIASYAFPDLSGFTVVGAGGSRTFSFTAAPSAPLAPLVVTATNGAGVTSPAASFTLVPDPTPPTVTLRCNGGPCRSTAYRRAVTVTVSASDGHGSGVDTVRYTTDGSNPTLDDGAEYIKPFTVHSLAHLGVRA